MPLIPEDEIKRQIELNFEINLKHFGEAYNPVGFFPPEMCYSPKIAEIIQHMGFEWIIIDEIGFNGKLKQIKNDRLYEFKNFKDFYVFFKEREFSAGLTYGKYPGLKEFSKDLHSKNRTEFLSFNWN